MIRAVIFDLDGVIIDSEPIHFMLEKQMFEELKIAVPIKEHNSYVGMSSQNMWEAIVKRHDLSYNPLDLEKRKHELYLQHLLNEKEVYPVAGIRELIKELHANNFKIVVASSAHSDVIDMVLKKFNLSDFFEVRVSGTELTHSKPNPEIFLKAAKLANCKPSECIVIEDSENGVTAAKAASMKCIGFLNPNSGVQDLSKADIIIKSFKELNVDFIKQTG